MDVLDPAVHPSPHRHTSSSSSSTGPRPATVAEDGGPVRFSVRRMSSNHSGSHSLARLDKEEIREREQLVNEYEAEEERLVNVLGRRMEELKNENTTLHNTMEGESEAVVNRLQRQLQSLQSELAALKQPNSSSALPVMPSDEAHLPPATKLDALASDPLVPSEERVLEALKRENEALRGKLADAERGFIHVSRLNDVYRDELVTHRTRLNLPTSDLTSPASSSSTASPSTSNAIPNLFSLPLHRRTSSSTSGTRSSRSPGPILNSNGGGARRVPIPASPTPMELDTGAGGGAERRTSFGAVQTGGVGSGGRVAERGQLRRTDTSGSLGGGVAGEM